MENDRYEVINIFTEESHGFYDTLEEARGAVEFDRLSNWSIWFNDERIEEHNPSFSWRRA